MQTHSALSAIALAVVATLSTPSAAAARPVTIPCPGHTRCVLDAGLPNRPRAHLRAVEGAQALDLSLSGLLHFLGVRVEGPE